MHEAETLSFEAIGRFVEAGEELRFEGENRQQVYGGVQPVRERCISDRARPGKTATAKASIRNCAMSS